MSETVDVSAAPPTCPPKLREAIDLLVGFVRTTASSSGRVEALRDGAQLADWFGAHAGLAAVHLSDADAAAARELRDALIAVFRDHCGCVTTPVEAAVERLRELGERYPVSPVITSAGVTFVPAHKGVAGLFGTVFAAASEVSAAGSWARLKVCKNPSCYGGFYDKTRNLAGQFCSPSCNSQVAMRAYRNRRKAG